MKRALSEPKGNPFWSDRTQRELQLQSLRPLNLPGLSETPVRDETLPPVPTELGEWSDGSERNPLQDVSSGVRAQRGRQRSRGDGLQSEGDRRGDLPSGSFRTPESWQVNEGLMPNDDETARRPRRVSEGLMPAAAMEELEGGLRTEGPGPGATPEEEIGKQTLERAMEAELVQHLLKENQDLKKNLMDFRDRLSQRSSQQPSSESWSLPEMPKTPRVIGVGGNDEKRFTPGGTQVPSGPPPGSDHGCTPWIPPPPLPPFPNLEYYEKCDGSVGPCHRELGKVWSPVQQRTGNRNDWVMFPGEGSNVQQWYLREALADWDRRHFRPDQSWRTDWNAGLEGSQSHLPPDQCHGGRAFASAEHGVPCPPPGVCPDGRACATAAVLGERHQHYGECQDSRAPASTALGGVPRPYGVCHDARALSGTVLGVHPPRPCEFPDHRAVGMSYHGDQPGHQQLPCHDLCDPTVEGVGGGSKGHGNRPLEKQGDCKSPRERSPQDALRSTNPTIPPLPAVNKRHASIEAADWLEEMKPIIGDISDRASKWWEMTMSRTWEVYHRWLQSNPLQRIRINPPDPVPWQELGNEQVIKRLEQRITTILLPALPTEMRNDLITSRQLWPCAILYKILRCYQPGGWAERSSLLTDLTATKAMKDAASAASALRLWHRQKQRAIELGASIPDALLQVRALEMIVSLVTVKQPQSLFRISTFRMEAGLDEKPTDTSIAQFLELLTAEMDAIALGTTSVDTGSAPSAKALQLDMEGKGNKNAETTSRPCRFWGTDSGCRHGKSCKFEHAALQDQAKRCFCCSSTEHRKQDCPYKNSQPSTSTSSVGGSGFGAGKNGGNGKGDKNKSAKGNKPFQNGNGNGNGKGFGNGSESQDPKVAAVNSTTSTTKDDSVISSTSKSDETQGSQEEPLKPTTGETELVNEVTSLLKSLRIKTAGPSVKVCQLRKLADGDRCVLLDGGATHCLRTCRDDGEWLSSKEIKVTLADGETVLRQLPNGTLITRQRVQSIVPVSLVASLGYNVTWNKKGCEMTHPKLGALPVTLSQGCPVVPEEVGMELMKKVEKLQHETCRIRAILAGEEEGTSVIHERLQQVKSLFPQVPLRLLQHVSGSLTWESETLPLNRKRRRQIEKAKTLVIYAFSGPEDKQWCRLENNGTVVVCLDLLTNHNLLDPHLSGWLEHILRTRGADVFLSSPPCRSTSLCRHRNDDGPKPLRGVVGEERFGLPTLSDHQQQQADMDSILWLKSLYWIWLGSQTNPAMKCVVESPQDPNQWCKSLDQEVPSFWKWPETLHMARLLGLDFINLQQGALGHQTPKPTTLMSNLEEIKQLHGLKDENAKQGDLELHLWEEDLGVPSKQWPDSLEDRLAFSKSLASWAPGLKNILANAILRLSRGDPPKCLKLSSEEMQSMKSWEAHIRQGHCPYRRDCAVCVESRGRNRPHVRQENVDAFCLALDISGPYEPGVDQEVLKPRYYLTGVITIPKSGDHPLVQGLRELGFSESEAKETLEVPLPSTSSSAQPAQTILGGTADHGRGNLEPSLKACEPQGEGDSDEKSPSEPLTEDGSGTKPPDPLSEAEVAEFEALDQQWKELLKNKPAVEVANLSQSIPIKSRSPKDVLQGLAVMVARLKALSVPIARIHTDRAKEFVSYQFRSWIRSRELIQSSTAGDEPMSNGRCESELGVVRGLARAAMKAAGCAASMWPLAVRYASECRLRDQLRGLGVPCPATLPFGLKAYAKRKTWHKVSSWDMPNLLVRLWGPAHDMTMKSGGYFAELPDGKFMRTTAIIVPATTTTKGEIQTFVKPDLQPLNTVSIDEAIADLEASGPAPLEEVLETHIDLEVFDKLLAGEQERADGNQHRQIRKPRRMHGKHTVLPDGQVAPALRQMVLRAGGESGEDDEQTFWLRSLKKSVDESDKLTLLQHRALEEVVQQLVSEVNEGIGAEWNGPIIQRVREEQRILEGYLRSMQACESEIIEQEVLQTKTVAMQEVRNAYQDWTKPFQEEYNDLVKTVIQPLDETELKVILNGSSQVERIPGKMVATVKPPSKKRGRIVACGNFISHPPGETSAGGLDCIALRAVLRKAAHENWGIATTDVRRAFLNAPRLEKGGRVTLVDPPMLLEKMGITKPGEVWRVTGALYGLCESPHDWSMHRDKVLQGLEWVWNGKRFTLQESEERNLWRILDATNRTTVGYICIYVDDLMVTGPATVVKGALDAIQKTWEVSEPEWVDANHWMRFCGFELQNLQGGGIALSQLSYVQELLNKHDVSGFESHPCGKIPEIEDEKYGVETLKTAQGLVGELQWLQGRTRPDLCYTISIMSRLIHRNPRLVISMAHHVLRYLNRTKDMALWYTPCGKDDWGENNVLHLPRSMERLEVYCDTSFGLEHEGGRSVQGTLVEWGGSPIQWSSSRQPFVASSTGEAELIGYSEGHQQGLSIGAILQTMEVSPTYVLYGDCKSALSLATTEAGPWRTRHLRLRAHRLREALRTSATDPQQEPAWSARHLSGNDLVADGLTKPLLGAAFVRFASRLSLHGSWLNNMEDGATCVKKCNSSRPSSVEDSHEETGKRLIAIGSLLIRGLSAVVTRCGHILIAVGAMLIGEKEDENVEAERGETNNQEGPRLCAFRVPGQHSEQAPVRPSRAPLESQAAQRGYAARPREFDGDGPSQQNATVNSEERVPPWWNHPNLQHLPGGKDRWMILEDRWLVRVHGETRRRSFQPIHRSCPVQAEQICSGRSTLVYPMSDPSYANRQCRHDTWTSMDLWSKDYLWKGFTIFELKGLHGEKKDGSQHESSGAPSMPGGQQSVRVEDGIPDLPYVQGGSSQTPPMMYGPTSYLRDPTPLNVTVNVNVAGGTTSSSVHLPSRKTSRSASSGDSEFEMVDED